MQQLMVQVPTTKKYALSFIEMMSRVGYEVFKEDGDFYSFSKNGKTDANYSVYISTGGSRDVFVGIRPESK